MARIKVLLASIALLAAAGCSSHKGMDRILSLKDLDKFDQYASEMTPEEGAVFEQTVLAEVRRQSVQLGLAAMAQGIGSNADPSRESDTSQMDAPLKKLQSLEGKTARAATIEILQVLKAALQAERERITPASTDLADLDKRIGTLDRKLAMLSTTH